MVLSEKINEYINNSKIKGKLARWKKSAVNVYITPIVSNVSDKEFFYSEIKRAMFVWNTCLKKLNINLSFVSSDSPNNSDIIVHWVKVGRVFEGMCKYLSVIDDEIKKVSIDIGLFNEYSPKSVTNESIFFSIMHEFGHSLGLGHGVDVDDVMYVPHKKNISEPSENDLYVLKTIYSKQ